MITSAEIRWFFKGIINNDILNFFRERQIMLKEEQPRTDWYLVNNDKFTSVKLRNGNIEIKKWMGSDENFQISPGIIGVAERWSKFGFGVVANDDVAKITSGAFGQWLQVDKKRSTVKFQIDTGGRVVPIVDGSYPPELCTLEICFIKTMKLDFWTLCFEAAAPEGRVMDCLTTVSKQVFANSGTLSLLQRENSYGYPQFLAKLGML